MIIRVFCLFVLAASAWGAGELAPVVLRPDLTDQDVVRILSPSIASVERGADGTAYITVDATEAADVCLIRGGTPAYSQRWIAVTMRSVDPRGWTNRISLNLRPRNGLDDIPGPSWMREAGVTDTVHWLVDVSREADLVIATSEPCAFDILGIVIREPTGESQAAGMPVKRRSAFPDPHIGWLDDLREAQGLDEILADMTVILCDEGSGGKVRARVPEIMRDFAPDFVDWSPISASSLAGEYGVRQSRGAWEYEEFYQIEGPEYWDRKYELFGESGFSRTFANTTVQTTVWAAGGHLTCHNGRNWHEEWLKSVWRSVFPQCEGLCQDNIGVALFHHDLCFCPGCYDSFRSYLLEAYSLVELAAMGIDDVSSFDVRERMMACGLSGEAALVDPVVREYIKFQNVSHVRNWRDAVLRVKERALEEGRLMPVTGNQIGADGYVPPAVMVSQYNDIVEIEALISVGERIERTLMHARVGRASARGRKPVWIRGPVRDGLSEDGDAMLSGTYWRVYLGEQAANGALRDFSFGMNAPWTGDQSRPEFIDSAAVMDAYREMAAFLSRYRPLFTRRESMARVGLIYSMPTMAWRGFGALDLLIWPFHQRNKDLLDRMDMRQVPADVVVFGHPEMWDDNEVLAGLGRYRVLVVGPADCMSDAQLDALRRFVASAGILLCFESDIAARDENFNPRPGGPKLPADAVAVPELASNVNEFLQRIAGVSPDAPTTVSLVPWLVLDGGGAAVHIVNYDVDVREEVVRPSPPLTLRLPIPDSVTPVDGFLVAPSEEPRPLSYKLERSGTGREIVCRLPAVSTYAVAVFCERGRLEEACAAADARREEDRARVREAAASRSAR